MKKIILPFALLITMIAFSAPIERISLGGDGDNCDVAISISCGDFITGTTDDNTDSGGETPAPDEWYSFTGSGVEEILTISFCGDGGNPNNETSYDTYITIFDSCNGTIVAQNDDICDTASEISLVLCGI